MSQTISDLWYGNLDPSAQCGIHDPKIQELFGLLERHKASLTSTISAQQAEVLHKYIDCSEEVLMHMSELAFTEGFCLACKLLTEALAV